MKKISLMCMLGLAMLMSMLCDVAGAESKPVLVVATFDAKGVGADDVEFVMDIFTSNFATLGFASIVDRSSFDKIKKELSFQDSDWSDSNKVAELGKALNANQVATGQLTKRRNKVVLTVKILDVNTTAIIASNIGVVDDVDAFLDVMPEFCNILIAKAGGGSSFSASTSRAQSSASYANYKIGDAGPGGGIVFYVSKEGFRVYDGKGGEQICHYLEMSKNTLGLSNWFPEYSNIGTQTGLGYGKSNTYKILNASISKGLTEGNCAAYRCSKYSTSSTKAGEWWLPSKDELDLMYKNQKERVLASCTTKWHWSSSGSGNGYAWVKSFGDGDWNLNGKDDNTNSVRAVRAF